MNNPERYHVLVDVIFLGERSMTLGDLWFVDAVKKLLNVYETSLIGLSESDSSPSPASLVVILFALLTSLVWFKANWLVPE